MIRQKTIIIPTVNPNNITLSLDQISVVVNETADRLLQEINELEHAFVSLKISHMVEGNRHLDRIFITVVYRETPRRRVLTEKAKVD